MLIPTEEPTMYPGHMLTMLSGMHARRQALRHPAERQDIRVGWPRVRPTHADRS